MRLGSFIESLAVVVMRPDDLVEFNRRIYASPSAISTWGAESLLAEGLTIGEKDLFAQLPIKHGRLLLLGLGGGDAIALAKMGFEVVGVDFIQEQLPEPRKMPPGMAFQYRDSCRKFPDWRSRPPLSTWGSFLRPCTLASRPGSGG